MNHYALVAYNPESTLVTCCVPYITPSFGLKTDEFSIKKAPTFFCKCFCLWLLIKDLNLGPPD